MEIVADRLDWTPVDEERWGKFLETETGTRLIPKLLESVPELLASGDTNAILIRSGEHRGLRNAVSQLLAMSHSTPGVITEVVKAYPDPEDDSQWADGQKLEPEKTKTPDPI